MAKKRKTKLEKAKEAFWSEFFFYPEGVNDPEEKRARRQLNKIIQLAKDEGAREFRDTVSKMI
jgi:hypothetical protein